MGAVLVGPRRGKPQHETPAANVWLCLRAFHPPPARGWWVWASFRAGAAGGCHSSTHRSVTKPGALTPRWLSAFRSAPTGAGRRGESGVAGNGESRGAGCKTCV